MVEVSYCVVNTGQRELLLRGLDAVAARARARCRSRPRCSCSTTPRRTGRPSAARAHPAVDEVIALDRAARQGARTTRALLQRARGRYALLLNEDSELLPGATAALHDALEERPRAAAAGARLLRPDGREQPSAWRFPGVARRSPARCSCTAARRCRAAATRCARSTGRSRRRCSSAARRPREVGWLDPAFFVYSRRGRLLQAARATRAGRRSGCRPRAAIHHEQLSTGGVPERRIVELARNRDRYMRKHHGAAAALLVRWLTAWAYAVRALAALVAARPRPAPLLAPRDRDAAAGARRGPARGGGRVQPRSARRLIRAEQQRALAGRGSPRATSTTRDERGDERARARSRDAVGRQQQLARDGEPAITATASASRPHSNGTGKSARVERVGDDEHHQVGAAQRDARAGDPERRRRAASEQRRR